MKPTVRDRFVLPVLLPIGILVVIGAVLYGLSRILLSLTPNAATVTALVVAIGVLAAASFAAASKQVRISTLGAMVGGVAGVAMLAGGIALAVVAGEGEGEEGEEERPVVTLAAANIAFEPTSLTAPAGGPFTLRFHNQDAGTPHDVDIFDNPELSGTPVFDGEVVTGVREIDYAVEALAPGPYAFRCSIHPEMTGELEAVESGGGGEGGGGEGGAGPGGVTVVAQGTAFDTSTIELPPSAPTTITFDNRDAGVQHNIAIYTDDTLSNELFNGEIITGPTTIDYAVPPIDPGSYYFLCIVHPTMNGSVEVAAGDETGGTGGTGGTGPPEPTGPS